MADRAWSLAPVTREDVASVASRLRDAEFAEIAAGSGETPAVAVALAVAGATEAWTIRYRGAPIAIAGVTATGEAGLGSAWAFVVRGAPARPLCEACRAVLGLMHRTWPHIIAAPWAGRDDSLRWLAWLGFRLAGEVPARGTVWRLLRRDRPCANLSPSSASVRP